MADKDLNEMVTKLLLENEELKSRLAEAEEAIYAIRHGEVDAIIVSGADGDKVYSLSSAETPYRIMLEEMEEGALSAREDGTILYCNSRFASLVSKPVVSLAGSNLVNLVTAKDRTRFLKLMHDGGQGKASSIISFINMDQAKLVHLKISLQPLSPGRGGEICMVASDVSKLHEKQDWLESRVELKNTELKTSKKRLEKDLEEIIKTKQLLEKNEKLLKSVIDNVHSGVALINEKGSVIVCNPLFLKLFGLPQNSSIANVNDQNWAEWKVYNETGTLIPFDDHPVRKASLTGKRVEQQLVEVRLPSGGDPIWMLISAEPLFKENGNIEQIICTYQDITEQKEAEKVIFESEERFRTITESLTVMIAIQRVSDSVISFVNEPFAKSFGANRQDLTGKIMRDIYYYPEDRIFLHDQLKIKGGVDDLQLRVKRANGSSFWIITSFKQINFNNEPSYLMTSIDISESKKIQEELLRLNRTFGAHTKSSLALTHASNESEFLEGICKIIIDHCGHTMVWIGYAQDDEAKSVKPVAHFGLDKGYIDQLNISWGENDHGNGPTGTAIRTGKPAVCQNMNTDPCFGPWRKAAVARGYSSSVVLPLKSEEKTFGAISIYSKEPDLFTKSEINLLAELADDLAYGITFIRLAEYEKKAAQAIKENEIRLRELVATKDKFFNIVAHDLKNPFTSLMGSSELLYSAIEKMEKGEIKKLAAILNDSAKWGYSILQNLLDWSRSQTGILKISPQPVSLKSIIDENIENLSLPSSSKGIALALEHVDDIVIVSDKNMLNTVLRNLLSNAVKFTHRCGKVTVRTNAENGELILSVTDTGIGIPQEKIDMLFRIDSKHSLPGTENEQGTGLGLKLSKEFVEKLGGRIWVESEINKGSKFSIAIPIKP